MPPQEILRDLPRKQRCNLIVLGTHGRTGLSRVLLGSVAEERDSALPRAGAHAQDAELLGNQDGETVEAGVKALDRKSRSAVVI